MCWTLAQPTPQFFPNLTLNFGTTSTQWEARSYMHYLPASVEQQETAPWIWCYSFQDDGRFASTTLGAAWFQHHTVVFDLDSHRLGIVSANCPDHRDRPAVPAKTVSFPLIAKYDRYSKLPIKATSDHLVFLQLGSFHVTVFMGFGVLSAVGACVYIKHRYGRSVMLWHGHDTLKDGVSIELHGESTTATNALE